MQLAKPLPPMTAHQQDRFWAKVEVNHPSACWQWVGATWKGYGQVNIDGRLYKAHRLAYALLLGDPPIDRQLDHLCRNTGCVNPDHLRIVSNRENGVAGYSTAGINARKTHCIRGHAFDDLNTIIIVYRGTVARRCRRCENAAQARRYHARKDSVNASR